MLLSILTNFRRIPPPEIFVKLPNFKNILAGRGGMFICSKLRQILSETEVRTLIRIQRVIWDHLLGEIIQKHVQQVQRAKLLRAE